MKERARPQRSFSLIARFWSAGALRPYRALELLTEGLAPEGTCAMQRFDDEVGYCLESGERCWTGRGHNEARVIFRGDFRNPTPLSNAVYLVAYVPDRSHPVEVVAPESP